MSQSKKGISTPTPSRSGVTVSLREICDKPCNEGAIIYLEDNFRNGWAMCADSK